MIERKVTKINDLTIEYVEHGSGPILVLVHGALASYRFYEQLILELSSSYRVIAPTLPGMGKSDNPKSQPSLESYSEIVATLVKQLNLTNCILVGHSMGGAVVTKLAEQHPDLAQTLILIDSAGIPYTNQAFQTVRGWIGGFIEYQRHKQPQSFWDRFLPWDMRHMLFRFISGWQVGRVLASIDLRSVYKKLNLPILIIWGAQDSHFPATNAAKIAALTKSSQTKIIPKYEHNWLGYHTAHAKELIDQFLSA